MKRSRLGVWDLVSRENWLERASEERGVVLGRKTRRPNCPKMSRTHSPILSMVVRDWESNIWSLRNREAKRGENTALSLPVSSYNPFSQKG